ncbi:amino acid adenylation domain-containing protein [Streptomyces netropsis]|uniref:amino acid adenylation domain-containing protein n=1 Tax=Streptomyces netropsis TaxID=55404 RepID=UPI0030D22271
MPAVPLSLPEALSEQILRTPDQTAIRDAEGVLTYRELHERVAYAAELLRAAGVRPGDVVGLQVSRSTSAVVALLGVLEAGAAYLPLDPAEPAGRAAGLLADAGAERVIVEGEAPTPGAPGPTPLPLAALLGRRSVEEAAPSGPTDPSRAAYVMCTSGTTGRPKAVPVPHAGVVRLVRDQGYARFGPHDTVLLHSPLSFDASVFEIFSALLNGGELVIAPPGRLSPAETGEVLRRHGVTTLYLTASLLRLIVDETPDALAGVRLLFTGGEAASADHLERLRRELPDRRLVNLYGPTENAVATTMFPVDPDRPVPSPVPIGMPVDDDEVHVMDEGGQPVPDGTTGELWLGGPGLALGYLGNAGLTEARFVPHPDGVPGHRLYRSGDLGHRRPDGALVYEGRADEQIKVEGHRVEPGEVEHALRRCPPVVDARVHLWAGPDGDRRLVAHLVLRPGADRPDPSVVRTHLAALLPGYMIPAQYVVLDRLPLKDNGKVDRDLLPPPPGAPVRATRLTPTEHAVGEIWRELLSQDAVGPQDDFFICGGTSIAASRLVSRIRTRMGVEVPLAVVFDTPTLAAIAMAADRSRESAARTATGPARGDAPLAPSGAPGSAVPDGARPDPAGSDARATATDRLAHCPAEVPARPAGPPATAHVQEVPVPLSLQQRARLSTNRAAADGRTQPVLTIHRLEGPLSEPALGRALDALTVRHDVLATRYPEGPEPIGLVAPAAGRHWPLEVRRTPPGALDGADALDAVADFGRRPLDLDRGDVARALLVTDGDRDHVLALMVDHLAFDEMSMEVVLGELAALYGEFDGGPPAGLEPAVQYQDYARMQAEWYASPSGRDAVDRAVEELYATGFRPPLPLPVCPGHDPAATGATRTVEHALPPVPPDTVRRLAARGITPYGFHLCVMARAVSRFTGDQPFGFQISQSGRHLPGTEGTVGCLTELAFVHFDTAGQADPADLFENTRRALVRLVTQPPALAAALGRLRADGRAEEVAKLRDRPYLLFHHMETPVTHLSPHLRLTALRPAPRPGARRDPVLCASIRSGPDGGTVFVEYVEAAYPAEFAEGLARAAADATAELSAWAGAR